jgi:hypothetical protein
VRFAPVPCGRTNSCEYCARRAAIENVLVVGLDAREASAPRHGVTLTTRDPRFDPGRFREAAAQWFRWLRREVGPVEYLGLVEFTTGRGQRAAGARRMHQHTLLKGLPEEADLDELWRQGKRRWEQLTGAWRIELRELRTAGGAVAYIVGHHEKVSQAPPGYWKGKRIRPSKGYFVRPVGELRAEVKASMRRKAEHRALEAMLAEADVDLGQYDPDVWESLLEQRRPAEPVRVVKVMRNGQQLVDAQTGELVDG